MRVTSSVIVACGLTAGLSVPVFGQGGATNDSSPQFIKTLVARRPMSAGAVLTLAMSYAARKHIPVVYAEAVAAA